MSIAGKDKNINSRDYYLLTDNAENTSKSRSLKPKKVLKYYLTLKLRKIILTQ